MVSVLVAPHGAHSVKIPKGQSAITPEPGDGYLHELSYMIQCIAAGQAPDLVIGDDGASAVEICEAEGEAIRTGCPVTLQP